MEKRMADKNTFAKKAQEFHKLNHIADLHCHPILGNLLRPQGFLDHFGDISKFDPLKPSLTLPTFLEGGVSIIGCALYSSRFFSLWQRRKGIRKQISQVRSWQEEDDRIQVITSPDQISLKKAGILNVFFSIEGGLQIKDDLSDLDELNSLGVRAIQPVHFLSNFFGAACHLPMVTDYGLTEKGKNLIFRLNQLGWMVDLAHCSEKTFDEIVEICGSPPMVSHMNLREFKNIRRNLTDKQIKAIAKRKGLLGLILFASYLRPYGSKVGIYEVAESLERLRDLAGPKSIALGTDMDAPVNLPIGLSSPAFFYRLTEELLRRGFREEELKDFWSGNFMTYWKRVWDLRA